MGGGGGYSQESTAISGATGGRQFAGFGDFRPGAFNVGAGAGAGLDTKTLAVIGIGVLGVLWLLNR